LLRTAAGWKQKDCRNPQTCGSLAFPMRFELAEKQRENRRKDACVNAFLVFTAGARGASQVF